MSFNNKGRDYGTGRAAEAQHAAYGLGRRLALHLVAAGCGAGSAHACRGSECSALLRKAIGFTHTHKCTPTHAYAHQGHVISRTSRSCYLSAEEVATGQGRYVRVSEDHKPDRPDERRAVEARGGQVIFRGTYRVRCAMFDLAGPCCGQQDVPYEMRACALPAPAARGGC